MTDNIFALEGELARIEGSDTVFSGTYLEGGDIAGVPTVKAYRNGSDETATIIPSGAASASGAIVTFPKVLFLDGDGGTKYVIVVTAVLNGNTDVRAIVINVKRKEDEI